MSCGGASRADTALPEFQGDIAHWRTPLDVYVPDPGKEQYAQNLVYGQCLRAAGFVPPPVQPPGSFIPPTFNSNVRRLFNVPLAKRYGYHAGKPAAPVVPETAANNAKERAARATCAKRATAELKVSDAASNLVYSLKGAAYQTAVKSEKFAQAGERWHECMLPLGLPDLPAKFEDGVMPTESQRKRFGMRSSAVADAPVGSLMPTTVAEVREAVFDARCRESSGLTATLYRLEVGAQQKLIGDNREKLGQTYQSAEESGTSIDKVIKRYAG